MVDVILNQKVRENNNIEWMVSEVEGKPGYVHCFAYYQGCDFDYSCWVDESDSKMMRKTVEIMINTITRRMGI